MQTKMYGYMLELEQIADLIKSHPDSAQGKLKWKIFTCKSNDEKWKTAEWDNVDPKRFKKRAEEIISKLEPDALKIDIKPKSTKDHETWYIRIDDTKNIPLLDDATPQNTQQKGVSNAISRKRAEAESQSEMLQEKSLNGLSSNSDASYGGLGELGMLHLDSFKKDMMLEQKIEKLKELEKVKDKLEGELGSLLDENETLETKVKKAGQWKTGIATGITVLGPLLGIDKGVTASLNGLLLGNGETAMPELTDGTQIDGMDAHRTEQIEKVVEFLSVVDDEVMQKVSTILLIINSNPALIDPIMMAAVGMQKKHGGTQSNPTSNTGEGITRKN